MANTKKHPSKRKEGVSFSIQRKVLRDFRDKCELKHLVPSNVVQELIEKWNQDERVD